MNCEYHQAVNSGDPKRIAKALHDKLTDAENAYFEAEWERRDLQREAFHILGAEVLGLVGAPEPPDPDTFGVDFDDQSDTASPETDAFLAAEFEWDWEYGDKVQSAVAGLVHGDPVREAETLLNGGTA